MYGQKGPDSGFKKPSHGTVKMKSHQIGSGQVSLGWVKSALAHHVIKQNIGRQSSFETKNMRRNVTRPLKSWDKEINQLRQSIGWGTTHWVSFAPCSWSMLVMAKNPHQQPNQGWWQFFHLLCSLQKQWKKGVQPVQKPPGLDYLKHSAVRGSVDKSDKICK